MRRVCCWCHLIYGEKCGGCGSLDVAKVRLDGGQWLCLNCGAMWKPDSEKDTHGICAACAKKSADS